MKVLVNSLSIFRIVVAFALVPFMLNGWYEISFILFALASISDWLDGYLAKKYNAATKIGGVLDHMGDKFLVANGLILASLFLQSFWIILPAIVMICRDLYVSGLREYLGTQKIEMPVPKSRFSMGKIKTTLQMLALSLIFFWVFCVNYGFYNMFLTQYLLYISLITLWLSLIASIWSAVGYTRVFISKLK